MQKAHDRPALPTYHGDIVGEIGRCDERDIVFARTDLFRFFGPGSPQYQEYYRAHPEREAYDAAIWAALDLGRTGGTDKPMFEAQFDIGGRIGPETFATGASADHRVEIPPARVSQKIKALAKLLGADLVGIGPLDPRWVYSHVGRSAGDGEGYLKWGTPIDLAHSNAIALGFAMDYDLVQCAPDFPVLLATARAYATGAWVSVQLAHYILMLGYSARAHHFRNYQVLCVPVAVDCGLGELSRAGYLLTREYGLALRLAVVTTDMPLEHDRPVDIAAQSFCENCEICAEACPVGAIPVGGKSAYNGLMKWKLAEEKCYRHWQTTGTDCAICMASCPWTKPSNWFHRRVASLASHRGPHQAALVRGHGLFYGKFKGRCRPTYLDSPTFPRAGSG